MYTALAESEGEGGRVEYLCKALDMAKESEFECVCLCVHVYVAGPCVITYIRTYIHTCVHTGFCATYVYVRMYE